MSAAAHNLTANPNLKMKLEGNTTNGVPADTTSVWASGVQAVRRALMLQGREAQVTTVSFGSERLAAEGDDEAAWSQNRRVEVVYLP